MCRFRSDDVGFELKSDNKKELPAERNGDSSFWFVFLQAVYAPASLQRSGRPGQSFPAIAAR